MMHKVTPKIASLLARFQASPEQCSQQLEQIRRQYGLWSAHNLELRPGLFTIAADAPRQVQSRVSLYAELIRVILRRQVRGLKMLDLGCLEGGISIGLAMLGARVTGIDVRSSHLAKARFAAEVLGLRRRCAWQQGDVTDPQLWDRLGQFDIVVCSGLLYHISAPDILPLLTRMARACRQTGLLIVDTNIAASPEMSHIVDPSLTLWGCSWNEHPPERNEVDRLQHGWSSLSNDQSFWLTERSLTNALVSAGFGTVLRPLYPYHEWRHQTRDVWVAIPALENAHRCPLRPEPDLRPLKHPGLASDSTMNSMDIPGG